MIDKILSIAEKITANVLMALYQPFWFSIILTVFILFFLMYAKEKGWKKLVRMWIDNFKTSYKFRRMFLLIFYTTMILLRTLLNRNMWLNPLSNVFGGWWIYNKNGDLTTEALENLILFTPFIMLLLWAMRDKLIKEMKLKYVIFIAFKITFIFSLSIEFLQLFLRLGTFQFSDLFYNTLGGVIGGILYWLQYKIKRYNKFRNIK